MTNDYNSLLAGHTWQIGSNSVNEFIFQYTKFKNAITADSHDPVHLFPVRRAHRARASTRRRPPTRSSTSTRTTSAGRTHDRLDAPRLQGRRATTSTSRPSAATSPPAPPASTPCCDDTVGLAGRQTSPSSAASPATHADQAVQRLLPGRHLRQQEPDRQRRPALRPLERIRSRPELEPDLDRRCRRQTSTTSRTSQAFQRRRRRS